VKLNKVKLTLTLVVLAVLAVLAISVVAAQDVPREETVIFDIDGGKVLTPDVWNPFSVGNRRDHGFHQAMIEPLFILNYETGEFVPWLGVSFTANDTLDEWTLKLRDGVKWSDGEPFTADDVVFTINLLLDPNNAVLSDAAALQQWVDTVTKVDDLTVDFKLKQSNPRFELDYFSVKIWGGVNIVPKHIWEGQDPQTFKNYDPEKGWPVFTGPYKLTSFNPDGTEFIYDRDDNYWGKDVEGFGLPAPKRAIWTWAGPEEARAALMANNGLDSIMDITLGAFLGVKDQNPNVKAWLPDLPYATLDPCSRVFEFNNAKAPWDNVTMRQAVNRAIDRDEIVKIAYEGTTVPSKSFFPAYAPLNRYTDMLDYNAHPVWNFNPDEAKSMIESLGYTMGGDGYYAKDGQPLAMDIGTHQAFIEKQRIAAVLVEQFQAVGINASTRTQAGANWDSDRNTGAFDVQMGWQNCGSVNEPWRSMDTLNKKWVKPIGELSTDNPFRWSNDRYSELVDQIGTLPLGDARIDPLFIEAMHIYLDELPTIPITQARKLIPHNYTYWVNWPTAENNYTSAWTWWQSTHIVIHNIQPAGGM
jgi:peptide/nickel transport system substrate-binding protein